MTGASFKIHLSRVYPLVFPLVLAVLCFFFMPLDWWGHVADNGLITILAFVLGAMLLRSMRTFPISTSDSFERESDIENLGHAYLHVTKVVATIGAVVALTMVVLMAVLIMDKVMVTSPVPNQEWKVTWIGDLVSAGIGGLIACVAERATYVVRLDIGIAKIQIEALQCAFQKAHQKAQKTARRQNESHDFSFRNTGPDPEEETAT